MLQACCSKHILAAVVSCLSIHCNGAAQGRGGRTGSLLRSCAVGGVQWTPCWDLLYWVLHAEDADCPPGAHMPVLFFGNVTAYHSSCLSSAHLLSYLLKAGIKPFSPFPLLTGLRRSLCTRCPSRS